MAEDSRLTLVKKWYKRAVKTDDPFDRFIYLWITLVIVAQRLRTHSGYSREGDTDREKILDYFHANSRHIFRALQENQDSMLGLARRLGTNYGNAIVDTGNPELRVKFSKLSTHYTQNRFLNQEELVETIAELLNKIRNNLFHGVKVYDDREDIALLELVNPVLLSILRCCESL